MRPHLANIATASLFSTFHSFAIGRSLSVVNNCKQTLWPAVHTSAGGSVAPSGWQAASGHEQVLEVAENWNGRICKLSAASFSH